jgi:hypothetical protein
MQIKSRKPTGFTLLVVACWIIAALAVVGGAYSLLMIGFLSMWFAAKGASATDPIASLGCLLLVLSIIVPAIFITVASGVTRRKRWAWLACVIIHVLIVTTILPAVVSGFATSSWFQPLVLLALSVAILFALFQPETRRLFSNDLLPPC